MPDVAPRFSEVSNSCRWQPGRFVLHEPFMLDRTGPGGRKATECQGNALRCFGAAPVQHGATDATEAATSFGRSLIVRQLCGPALEDKSVNLHIAIRADTAMLPGTWCSNNGWDWWPEGPREKQCRHRGSCRVAWRQVMSSVLLPSLPPTVRQADS